MDNSDRIRRILQQAVDGGEIAGAVAAVWRDDGIEMAWAGWRDMEAQLPVERDTIFRIASMTKPVTSVAALMLVDEGKIAVHDPITKYAPEFAHMRVLKSPDGPLDDTESSIRDITFEDLLTHRSGLTYKDFHKGPIAGAYHKALGGDIDSDVAPEDWIRRLASLPLIAHPGREMHYGRSTDLLGFLLARIEGTSLGAVLERRIFAPLGMTDTGFVVSEEKRKRRSASFGFDEEGRLMQRTVWGGPWGDVFVAERPKEMRYESGGQGLWSTVDDYLKFGRLFLGDGAVDGVRLLRPETLARMMTNQLTDVQRANFKLLGQRPFAVGRGFGLGVSVVLETDRSDMMRRGGVGTVSWPGAYGGWWQADPKEKSVQIFLAHSMVGMPQMAKGIGLGVWAAIEEFQTAVMTLEREAAG